MGNEPVRTDGKGRAFGAEFFVQQKLTEKFDRELGIGKAIVELS